MRLLDQFHEEYLKIESVSSTFCRFADVLYDFCRASSLKYYFRFPLIPMQGGRLFFIFFLHSLLCRKQTNHIITKPYFLPSAFKQILLN